MAASGPKIEDVAGWRVSLLLLCFATLTVVLEVTLEYLEKRVKKRKSLQWALHAVKTELLYVGIISLLLSAFQDLLAQICIKEGATSVAYRRLLADAGSGWGRRLMAGGEGADGSGDYLNACGPGEESLWPVSLQHDTHVFIFVVACTHVLYSTFTIMLTLYKIKQWKKWEEMALLQSREPKVMRMSARWLYGQVGSNRLFHAMLSMLGQFTVSVSHAMYHNARLMFIEKLALPHTFDFHGLVIVSMEEELARTLRTEWHLWLIAVVWYAIPPPAYVPFWFFGLALLVLLLVGGKLVDVLIKVAMQVAVKYKGESVVFGRMNSDARQDGAFRSLGRHSLPRGRPMYSQVSQTHAHGDAVHAYGHGEPSHVAAARGSVRGGGPSGEDAAIRARFRGVRGGLGGFEGLGLRPLSSEEEARLRGPSGEVPMVASPSGSMPLGSSGGGIRRIVLGVPGPELEGWRPGLTHGSGWGSGGRGSMEGRTASATSPKLHGRAQGHGHVATPGSSGQVGGREAPHGVKSPGKLAPAGTAAASGHGYGQGHGVRPATLLDLITSRDRAVEVLRSWAVQEPHAAAATPLRAQAGLGKGGGAAEEDVEGLAGGVAAAAAEMAAAAPLLPPLRISRTATHTGAALEAIVSPTGGAQKPTGQVDAAAAAAQTVTVAPGVTVVPGAGTGGAVRRRRDGGLARGSAPALSVDVAQALRRTWDDADQPGSGGGGGRRGRSVRHGHGGHPPALGGGGGSGGPIASDGGARRLQRQPFSVFNRIAKGGLGLSRHSRGGGGGASHGPAHAVHGAVPPATSVEMSSRGMGSAPLPAGSHGSDGGSGSAARAKRILRRGVFALRLRPSASHPHDGQAGGSTAAAQDAQDAHLQRPISPLSAGALAQIPESGPPSPTASAAQDAVHSHPLFATGAMTTTSTSGPSVNSPDTAAALQSPPPPPPSPPLPPPPPPPPPSADQATASPPSSSQIRFTSSSTAAAAAASGPGTAGERTAPVSAFHVFQFAPQVRTIQQEFDPELLATGQLPPSQRSTGRFGSSIAAPASLGPSDQATGGAEAPTGHVSTSHPLCASPFASAPAPALSHQQPTAAYSNDGASTSNSNPSNDPSHANGGVKIIVALDGGASPKGDKLAASSPHHSLPSPVKTHPDKPPAPSIIATSPISANADTAAVAVVVGGGGHANRHVSFQPNGDAASYGDGPWAKGQVQGRVPSGSDRANGSKGKAARGVRVRNHPPARTSSGRMRRRVPWYLLPVYCNTEYPMTPEEYVDAIIEQRAERGLGEADVSEFFWFGSPRLITRLFTLVYFGNSLSLANTIFGLTGGYESSGTWTGIPQWSAILLVFLDLLLIVHSSFYVLPLYALIQPLGNHCPKSVVKRAVKAGLFPHQTRVIAKALNLQLESGWHQQHHGNAPRNLFGAMRQQAAGLVRRVVRKPPQPHDGRAPAVTAATSPRPRGRPVLAHQPSRSQYDGLSATAAGPAFSAVTRGSLVGRNNALRSGAGGWATGGEEDDSMPAGAGIGRSSLGRASLRHVVMGMAQAQAESVGLTAGQRAGPGTEFPVPPQAAAVAAAREGSAAAAAPPDSPSGPYHTLAAELPPGSPRDAWGRLGEWLSPLRALLPSPANTPGASTHGAGRSPVASWSAGTPQRRGAATPAAPAVGSGPSGVGQRRGPSGLLPSHSTVMMTDVIEREGAPGVVQHSFVDLRTVGALLAGMYQKAKTGPGAKPLEPQEGVSSVQQQGQQQPRSPPAPPV